MLYETEVQCKKIAEKLHGTELNFYLRNHDGDRFLSQVSFAVRSAGTGVISGMRSCSFSAEPTTSSVEPPLPLRLA
jgi:hypothetical protein